MFDTIIIDTNAFEAKDYDFMGMMSNSIPSLFESLKNNNIKILTHEILLSEIKKHLSKCNEKIDNAKKSIARNRSILEYVGVEVDKVNEKIDSIANSGEIVKKMDELFEDAEVLEYSNPKGIFDKYFHNEPPFSKKRDKKSEFPDAFVIESLLDYVNKKECTLLVVTNDDDWKESLCDCESVKIVRDINETLREINQLSGEINKVFRQLSSSIEKKLDVFLKEANYIVSDYDVRDYVDVNSIDIVDISRDIVPVKITDEEMILQANVNSKINGETTVFDTENSIWDSETKTYIMKEFSQMEFEEGTASTEFEVVIKKRAKGNYDVESVKLVNDSPILISVDEDKLNFIEISFDTDFYAERDDAFENYYMH